MINYIEIEETENSPKIILDADNGIIEFEGKSYPDNTFSFYTPIIEWLEDYFEEFNQETTINFKFSYFNSATTQVIFDILDIVKQNHSEVLYVNWFYYEDNENIYEDYEDYAEEFPELNIQAIVIQRV